MTILNQEESVLVQEFREQVKDILANDYERSDTFLIRWLRARELNLENAELMLRSSVQWRKLTKIDEVLACAPDPYFTKNFPYWLNGTDLNGRPVLCIPMGDWDVRQCVEDGRIDEFSMYMSRIFERVVETIKECNSKRRPETEPVTQFSIITDWDKFSIRQTSNLKAVQSLLGACQVYEAHFPEILGQALFINTNTVFQAFFALMKPILAPRTLGKIVCYGTNRKEWEPVVRSMVEETQIARRFGG